MGVGRRLRVGTLVVSTFVLGMLGVRFRSGRSLDHNAEIASLEQLLWR